MTGPLEGVKVVELGMWVAGPACAGILADWGADVIKLEPPGGGDPARSFQALFGQMMPDNPVFELDNRSKRGIAIDLRVAEGQQIARKQEQVGVNGVTQTVTGYKWVSGSSNVQLIYFAATDSSNSFRVLSVHYNA